MLTNSAIDLKARIFFYCRHSLFNQMLNASREGKVQYKGDISYHLYEAVALILLNQLEEGIQHLEKILSNKDTKLAATVALKFCHEIIGSSSKEYISRLEAQIRETVKSSSTNSLYYCAFSLVAFTQFEKSLEYINKTLTVQNDNSEYHILKGWILLQLENVKLLKDGSIHTSFERALQLDPKSLDAIIGMSEYYLIQINCTEALNIINKAVVLFTSTELPLMQKLRIQFAMFDWNQVIETTNRITSNNSKNVYAKRIMITALLCYSANYGEAIDELTIFKNMLDTEECKNSTYKLESSKLFSRICNKNSNVLELTSLMLENALTTNSENLEVLVEMGNQCLMRNDIKNAFRYYYYFYENRFA